MPANTTKLSLPYPVGTDKVSLGDDSVKNLAETVDEYLLHTPDFGTGTAGRRAFNLCTYSESVSNGLSHIVIQTNITDTSGIMSSINITGLMYEPENAMVNIDVKWYPFTDSVQHRWEVVNKGSFHCQVQIWSRNSDKKIAIVLTPSPPASFFNYPKLAVDGIFGHDTHNVSVMQNWTMFRAANMNGYTVKQSTISPRPSGEDSGWIDLPLVNGWYQYGSGFDGQYRRRGGIVHFRGLVRPGADVYQPLAYLPAGFRPSKETLRGVTDYASAKRMLYVYANGTVQFPNGVTTGNWVSLETSYPCSET